MTTRLQLTVFDLQDGTRLRDAVVRAMLETLGGHTFTPGQDLDRDLKQIRADLLDFLQRMGMPEAEAKADTIMRDGSRALVHELLNASGD